MAFSLISDVLTRYKAEVTDHVRGLEKLKGAERERAKETIEANKKIAESYDVQIKGLHRLTEAFSVAKGMVNVAIDSFKAYTEHSRLATAAGGADIDRLRKASAGLKTDTQLLSDAARFQAGAFKLTGDQMVTVERAMRLYNQSGLDSAKVNQALTQAVTALKTDGLKDLGIFVDMTGLSMEKASDKGEIFRRIMARLTEETKGVNDSQLTAAERAAATGVSFENSIEKIKLALGQLVVAMVPVIEKVAQLAGYVTSILTMSDRAPGQSNLHNAGYRNTARFRGGALLDFVTGNGARAAQIYSDDAAADTGWNDTMLAHAYALREQAARMMAGQQAGFGNFKAGYSVDDMPLAREAGRRIMGFIGDAAAGGVGNIWLGDGKKQAPGRPRELTEFGANIWNGPSPIDVATQLVSAEIKRMYDAGQGEWAERDQDFAGKAIGSVGGFASGVESTLGKFAELTTREGRYSEFAGRQSKSKLEGMFGPIQDFDLYAKGFQMLQGAVGSALTAWIDGSTSAGKAVKAFIGEAVKGLAIQAAMQALHHGAFALGHLAFGDMIGAGRHGKAAAAFAGVAVVASAAAKAMGGGGGSTPGAGAGAAAPVGGAGGYGQPSSYQATREVIFVNDTFGMNSTREAVQQFRRRSDEAYGAPGTKNS